MKLPTGSICGYDTEEINILLDLYDIELEYIYDDSVPFNKYTSPVLLKSVSDIIHGVIIQGVHDGLIANKNGFTDASLNSSILN